MKPTVKKAGQKRRVTFAPDPAHPYYVTIILDQFPENPIVTEILVREPVRGVSPREVRRLPLATYVQAALAEARKPGAHSRMVEAPKGQPRKGRSTGFYQEIADAYRSLQARGVPHPAKEIARRKRVDPNMVHQWVHVARRHGFLEPPTSAPRKGKR